MPYGFMFWGMAAGSGQPAAKVGRPDRGKRAKAKAGRRAAKAR